MAQGRGVLIVENFGGLEDPRIERCKRHQLLDTIAICAVICGAGSWVHVEMFGKSKEDWFRTFLDLPYGIPSHDTSGDVFSRLDPDRFQECFMECSRSVAGLLPGEVVAIDGKTVRRSHDKVAGKQAMHLVSAWASPEPVEGLDGAPLARPGPVVDVLRHWRPRQALQIMEFLIQLFLYQTIAPVHYLDDEAGVIVGGI